MMRCTRVARVQLLRPSRRIVLADTVNRPTSGDKDARTARVDIETGACDVRVDHERCRCRVH